MAFVNAANILQVVELKHGSIKALIQKNSFENKKQLYALVCETLRYQSILDVLIEKTAVKQHVKQLRNNAWLARVLVYALIFGKGLYGKEKIWLSKCKSALSSELARMKIRKKVINDEELLEEKVQPIVLPRYVRVNTLKTTVEDTISHFVKEGFNLVDTSKHTYESFMSAVRELKAKDFMQDININELLLFPSSTDFHAHDLYVSGKIILQDKASCMPAFVLGQTGVQPGSHAIDSCAAPGNKTSHLAAIMQNNGQIFAFDKDAERLGTMNNMLSKAGASCVKTCHKDFLKTVPSDHKYKAVRYAIVDPSCSGSGIVSRLNTLTDDEQSRSAERLHKLSQFQRHVLTHALSFPAMQRAVYSTCSVHDEENEQVVEAVFEQVKDKYDVIDIATDIPSRGRDTYPQGPKCLRLGPDKDATNGFFIACFQRKDSHQKLKAAAPHNGNTISNVNQSEHGRCQSDTVNELSTKKDISETDHFMVQSKGIDTQNGSSSLQNTNRKRKRADKHRNINLTELANFEQSSKKSKEIPATKPKSLNTQVQVKPISESSGEIAKQSKKKQKKKKRNCKPVTRV